MRNPAFAILLAAWSIQLSAWAISVDDCITSKRVGWEKSATIQSQRETITTLQEELSRWRRTLRQRVKESPEWDRKTFEETAP